MLTPVGQSIGNYRIEERLGSGGMGEVFRAVHIQSGQPVAIKVLRSSLAADPTFRTRFMQEVQAAAALQHPNIVEIYEFGEEDGQFYLAMELATAGSLRTLLQYSESREAGQPLPLPLSLDLVRQTAEGLAYAHAHGMIHRDIRPDNLLLTRAHEPGSAAEEHILKICDFGLGTLGIVGGPKAAGDVTGTPAYMSPEQCQGLELDGRSDLYSLGVVLYEAATGYIPFQAQTMSEAAYKHVYVPPVPPRQVRPELPATLEAIILRCLAKKPEERYASGAELAQALQGVLDEIDATSAAAPTAPEPPSAAPPVQPSILPVTQPTTKPSPQTGPASLAGPEQTKGVESAMPPAPGAARLAITLEQETLAITPGQPATWAMELANLGQIVDHLKVVVEGVPAAWVQAPSEYLQLNPGAQLPATVAISVPKVAASRAGEYAVTVRAISRENPAESASATAHWTVRPFTDDSLVLRPERAAGRGQAAYELTLQNDGNAAERYALRGEDAEQKLTYQFAQEPVAVAPGATSSAGLTVRGRRRWLGRQEQPYPFTIRAKPQGDRPPLSATGQFVNVPVLPYWMIAGIALVIVAGLVAGYLFGPRPVPSHGTVTPYEIDIIAHYQVQTIEAGTSSTTLTESCPASEVMLNGGYSSVFANGVGRRVTASYPSGPSTWTTMLAYQPTSYATTLTVYIVCARANFPITPSQGHVSPGQVVDVQPGSQNTAVAACPTGTVLTGGGYKVGLWVSEYGPNTSTIRSSRPISSAGWQVQAYNIPGVDPFSLQAYAVCASGNLRATWNLSAQQSVPYDGKSTSLSATCASGSLAGGGYSTDDGFAYVNRPALDAKRWDIQFVSTAREFEISGNRLSAYAVCVQPSAR